MGAQLSTYSGSALSGAITCNAIGINIPLIGIEGQGIEEVTVRMSTDQSNIEISMDGAAVPSVIPGDNGEIEISVYQQSTVHQELLAWYNILKAQRDAGNWSNWFATSVLLIDGIAGSQHYARGCAPKKVPDKTYQKQAQRVSWVLVACDIKHT